MPQKRRVLSCSNCRRLKTRCTILPGVSRCSRCHNLKLECILPASQPSSTTGSKGVSDEQVIVQKITAVEASLDEIKELLRKSTGSATPIDDYRIEHATRGDSDNGPEAVSGMSEDDKDVSIAPVSTVRDFAVSIDGPLVIEQADLMSDLEPIKDALEILEDELIARLWKILGRYKITDSISLPSSKFEFPLFFYTCLLLALQGDPNYRASNLHAYLHGVAKEHLGKTLLNTPGHMPFVQTLLIFSMWSLETNRSQYTDSWLLSGLTYQHWILASKSSSFDWALSHTAEEIDHMMRLSIMAQTENLKFSIGTGQFAVVDRKQIESNLAHAKRRLSQRDDLGLVAEFHLFLTLYNAIIQKDLDIRGAWARVEAWSLQHLSADDQALSFAHSSTTLILARWESARLAQLPHLGGETSSGNGRAGELDDMVISHSKNLLKQMVRIGREVCYVKTAYDRLLGSYAAITLVEYASCVSDLSEVLSLMQLAAQEQELYGYREPILNWTCDMMRKRMMERSNSQDLPVGSLQAVEQQSVWIPSDLVRSSGFDFSI